MGTMSSNTNSLPAIHMHSTTPNHTCFRRGLAYGSSSLAKKRPKRKMRVQRKHAIAINAVLTSLLLVYIFYSCVTSWHDGFYAIWERIFPPVVMFPFSYLMIAFPKKCNAPAWLLRWFLCLTFLVLPLFSLLFFLEGNTEEAVINLTILNGLAFYINIHFDDMQNIIQRSDN